jgi:hypothetical protein
MSKKTKKENQGMLIVREKAREYLLKSYSPFLKVQIMSKINMNTVMMFPKF